MRDMLRIVLRRDPYDVLVARNGKDALEFLQKAQVDQLLSDIRMPDVSGVNIIGRSDALLGGRPTSA